MTKSKPTNPTLKKEDTRYKAGIQEQAFLDAYSISGSVTLAARVAKLDRSTIYAWRNQYPEFAKKMDTAKEEAVGILEGELFRRAKEKSDILLIFALKSLKPETYGDKIKQEHSGQISHEVTQLPDLSQLTFEQLYELKHGHKPNGA